MTVSLTKGGNVCLTKLAPALTAVPVGLGWDVRTTTGADFDLDASAIAVRRERQGRSTTSTSSSSTTSSPPTARSSTPVTTSPARARATTRPINVDLADRARRRSTRSSSPSRSTTPTPRPVASARSRNAFIRVVDQADGTELARYDLTEDASTETAMVFGELYRNGGEWKFRAVGQGYASGLARHRPRLRRQRLTARTPRQPSRAVTPQESTCDPQDLRLVLRRHRSSASSARSSSAGRRSARARRDPGRPGDLALLRQRGRQRDHPGEDERLLAEDLPDRRHPHRRLRHAAAVPAGHRRRSPPSSNPVEAVQLALEGGSIDEPGTYAYLLHDAHPAIAAFGGMFLLHAVPRLHLRGPGASAGCAGSRSRWPRSASSTSSRSSSPWSSLVVAAEFLADDTGQHGAWSPACSAS